MGDLEETIFQHNVPGRWSTYDGMHGSDRRGGGGSDDECDAGDDDIGDAGDDGGGGSADPHSSLVTEKHSHVPAEVRQRILADRDRKTQTGVKGVLADAKAARALDRAEEQGRREQRAAVLRRMVQGHTVSAAEDRAVSLAAIDAELRDIARQQEQDGAQEDDEEDFEYGDEDDDEYGDDDFLRAFRERRLLELRAGTLLPMFGACEDVDAEQFVDAIETPDPRVTVCVHLYDPAVPACARLNRLLDEVAPAMPHVHFLRLPAGSGGMQLDRATLPILSLYRGGEMHKMLAAVAQELGTELFSAEDVQALVEANL